ncbi:MAG TPA: hypothetical protein PKC84_06665 [Paracoccaceae bacterium]|nr:hypothetical protein [Paracoccaceae bacterium]
MTLTLAACAAPGAPPTPGAAPRSDGPLRVAGFQHWQGADARRAADARCGGRGVAVSIYDRFDRGAAEWVYAGGCA